MWHLIFLVNNMSSTQGSCLTMVREGARNFCLEVQALIAKTNFGNPRRTAHGFELGKLHLLLAVLSKFMNFPAENFDAYLNVIGGMKIRETSADLAICASLLSSKLERDIDRDTIFVGEVGLTGEIRSVRQLENRIMEA